MSKPMQIVLLSCFLILTSLMTHAKQFTQEPQLAEKMTEDIQQFWQTGQFASFQGKANTRINYAAFITAPSAQCVVISPGRSEGYLKYQELAYDISQFGINLFIIDHRGQGLSQRMLTNPHKGYVKAFDDYADDLHYLLKEIMPAYCDARHQPLIIAHSMGSAIAIRMMQKYPNSVKAALLSSPMIAINSGGLPMWLAKTLIKGGKFFNSLLSEQPWYFFGQTDYQATPFDDNRLMHSRVRYQYFIDLYQQHPELQLGGVTFNWLDQAIAANHAIFAELDKINTPLTILQAGADTVVNNQAQLDFCRQLSQTDSRLCPQPIIIEQAYHELFFEQDIYRNQALTHLSQWLNDNISQ